MSEYAPLPPEAKESVRKLDITVIDKRTQEDAMQIERLKRSLRAWRLKEKLIEFYASMPSICVKTNKINITIVDGSLGSGEVRDGNVNVNLPSEQEMVAQVKGHVQDAYPDATEEALEELAYDIASNVALHECLHALIESYPGSNFHQEIVLITGEADEQAAFSTFVDELLVVTLQKYYTEENALIGDISPSSDRVIDEKQKILYNAAENLQPAVALFFEGERTLKEFLELLAVSAVDIYEQ
jgi:hypothetical protein